MQLAECVQIDINSGFKDTVTNEVNEILYKLQNRGCKILDISHPLPDGRKVYVTVRYDDPSVVAQAPKEEEDVSGPQTTFG